MSINVLVPFSRKWRPWRWNAEDKAQSVSCSLSLQSFRPMEGYLAVVSTLPISPKGALILTPGFVGGMLNVYCPETWQEAAEYVTLCWRPLSPETPVVAEIVQCTFRTPRRGDTPASGFLWGEDASPGLASIPQSFRGGAQLATLSFWVSHLQTFRNQTWLGLDGWQSRRLSTAGEKPHKTSS